MSSWDVIVIGTGPAGCAAASTCMRAGLSVMMVCDATEPETITAFMPEPLESIHPGVSSLLHKIGAGGVEQQAVRATYNGIYTNGRYTPLGEDAEGPWIGLHISRRAFNAQLVEAMRRIGISIRFDEKVESLLRENNRVIGIRTTTSDWLANYVVDASGKKGIAGKQLQWKRQFFSLPLVCWTGVAAIDATFPWDTHAAHFISGDRGWTWLAPQPPGYCAWTKLSAKGEKTFLPPDELSRYESVSNIAVANMRWRMYRPLCSEGILLCGDAGGVLDPAAGQGILNALLSGVAAGNTIVACMQQPDYAGFHLAHYDDWFVRHFEMKTKQLSEYYTEQGIEGITG